MAGIEKLEIHSKSYIVRWVKVDEGYTISWSVQPHKKSINFGIFKHPGSGSTGAGGKLPSSINSDETTTNLDTGTGGTVKSRRASTARNEQSTAIAQLRSKGFLTMEWHGKCEADKVSTGTYAVTAGQGGMYGLVFDNTFSKQVSKTATFVLLTYPTDAPPASTQQLRSFSPSFGPGARPVSVASSSTQSPRLNPSATGSVESFHNTSRPRSRHASSAEPPENEVGGNYHVGMLQKRRRKRGQGYAHRFFSLDFASCTLSYYYNRNSSALRGAIPLSLAAIAADASRREISIDSGAEIWHLKAANQADFDGWAAALERASNTARGSSMETTPTIGGLKVKTNEAKPVENKAEEDREWAQVEALVSRIAGTRDAVRRLYKETAPKPSPPTGLGIGPISPSVEEGSDYFNNTQQRRSFWKKKGNTNTPPVSTAISASLAVPAPTTVTTVTANGSITTPHMTTNHINTQEENDIHEHCASLLNDLDTVVADFSVLVANSKRRRMPLPKSAPSRNSMDSVTTDVFFDAEGGDNGDDSQLLVLNGSPDEEDTPQSEPEEELGSDALSTSSVDQDEPNPPNLEGAAKLFPPKPKSLLPLPITTSVKRRNAVPPAKVLPPSLIGFLRKNVGKDLSTISMPVSANEPISLLQRTAEQLEYSSLLDIASQLPDSTRRLLYIAAFAVSGFSNNRAKERAIRKPFNPMLGETYELVRDGDDVASGFRLLAEKVCHRPVILATQAESANWSFAQSPAPSQKFWGKSAELTTEGRVRIALRLKDGSDEFYSYDIATVFLRNIVMGEKYVEPVGSMAVLNESSGAKAQIEFKTKGMFGGRSEDVEVGTFDEHGNHTGISLTGTWTTSLKITPAGKGAGEEIWHAGKLVDNAPNCYGFTEFAAALNEIGPVEKGALPPTDSRLRKDQRLTEEGNLDEAEEMKAKIEEGQRRRRREMEEAGQTWTPRWFTKIDGDDEVWRLRTGKEGYWEERAKGKWEGVVDVLEAQ